MNPNRAYELLQKLQTLCPMRRRKLRVFQQDFQVWSAIDLDLLMENLAQLSDDHPDVIDERLPYWAEIWPSARVLAEAILTQTPPENPCWLELGCGPGLAGLAASSRGCRGIWTDYMPEALQLAELNAITANVPDIQTRILDWRSPPDDLQVGWILASDVAYENRNFVPLMDCFETLLTPKGEVWLGEPGRDIAKEFFQILSASGWHHQCLLRVGDVRVHRLHR